MQRKVALHNRRTCRGKAGNKIIHNHKTCTMHQGRTTWQATTIPSLLLRSGVRIHGMQITPLTLIDSISRKKKINRMRMQQQERKRIIPWRKECGRVSTSTVASANARTSTSTVIRRDGKNQRKITLNPSFHGGRSACVL